MCFSSKPKVQKTDPDALRAPEPVMAEETKGVELGDTDSEFQENIGTEGLKIDKKASTGEGTQSRVATDTGATKATKSTGIRKALSK